MNSTETYFKIRLYLGIFRNSSAFPGPHSRSGSGAGGGAPPRGCRALGVAYLRPRPAPPALSGFRRVARRPRRRGHRRPPAPSAQGSCLGAATLRRSARDPLSRAPAPPRPRAPGPPRPRAGHAQGRSRARAGKRTPNASAILAENGQPAARGCDLAVCPAPGARAALPGRSLGLRGAGRLGRCDRT